MIPSSVNWHLYMSAWLSIATILSLAIPLQATLLLNQSNSYIYYPLSHTVTKANMQSSLWLFIASKECSYRKLRPFEASAASCMPKQASLSHKLCIMRDCHWDMHAQQVLLLFLLSCMHWAQLRLQIQVCPWILHRRIKL